MIRDLSQRPRLLVIAWVAVSMAVALLPPGVGGLPRVLNALLFMGFAPGVAVVVALRRSITLPVACVTGLVASLTILVLSSQLLLALDMWTAPGVAAIVSAATLTLLGLLSLVRAKIQDPVE